MDAPVLGHRDGMTRRRFSRSDWLPQEGLCRSPAPFSGVGGSVAGLRARKIGSAKPGCPVSARMVMSGLLRSSTVSDVF